MDIKGLQKLDNIITKLGDKIKPQILDGIRDGAKKIRKDFIRRKLEPTKENIMTDLTSDKRYLEVLAKANVSEKDVENIVDEILKAPDTKTYRDEPAYKKFDKVGRNMPCPCGSGKKYKKCCGF